MKLKWYGHAAFRLESNDGLSIITDPYTPELLGYRPIEETADVVIISSDYDDAHCRHDLIPGSPAVVNAMTVAENGGKQTVKDLTIEAIEALEIRDYPGRPPGQNGMYRFEMDGLRVAHMGDVGNPLNEAQIDFFKDVDVLLALAGGYLTIELDDLKTVIEQAKPKYVIPMHFRTLTYVPRNSMWIESFLSYFDDDDIDFAFDYKTELNKDDIPDQTRVLVMDYLR